MELTDFENLIVFLEGADIDYEVLESMVVNHIIIDGIIRFRFDKDGSFIEYFRE